MDLAPLTGVRVLACIVVLLFHVGPFSALATSSWTWYALFKEQYWPNVVCGSISALAMNVFLLLTGLLAAYSLVPRLEKAPSFKVLQQYWLSRLKRIVLPFYIIVAMTLATPALLKVWPGRISSTAKDLCDNMGAADWREAWASCLFLTNILGRIPIPGQAWNLPLQMQFYLLLPLLLLLLSPRSAHFRRRLAYSCVCAIAASLVYRAVIVRALGICWPVPEQAVFNKGKSAGHKQESVIMALQYFVFLYCSFTARLADFAAGILVYLCASDAAFVRALRNRRKLSSSVSAVVCAILGYMCFGGHIPLHPESDCTRSATERYGILVLSKGLWSQFSVGWLLLQLMVQPDAISRQLAPVLSGRVWQYPAHISYHVYLVHPMAFQWLLRTVDVVRYTGPFETFTAYAVLCVAGCLLAAVTGACVDLAANRLQGRMSAMMKAPEGQGKLNTRRKSA